MSTDDTPQWHEALRLVEGARAATGIEPALLEAITGVEHRDIMREAPPLHEADRLALELAMLGLDVDRVSIQLGVVPSWMREIPINDLAWLLDELRFGADVPVHTARKTRGEAMAKAWAHLRNLAIAPASDPMFAMPAPAIPQDDETQPTPAPDACTDCPPAPELDTTNFPQYPADPQPDCLPVMPCPLAIAEPHEVTPTTKPAFLRPAHAQKTEGPSPAAPAPLGAIGNAAVPLWLADQVISYYRSCTEAPTCADIEHHVRTCSKLTSDQVAWLYSATLTFSEILEAIPGFRRVPRTPYWIYSPHNAAEHAPPSPWKLQAPKADAQAKPPAPAARPTGSDYAEAALRKLGPGPHHARAMLPVMEALGYRTASPERHNSVQHICQRHQHIFKRVAPNTWELIS